MNNYQKFVSFIESVCKAYSIPEAIKPLTDGFDALVESSVDVDPATIAKEKDFEDQVGDLITGIYQDQDDPDYSPTEQMKRNKELRDVSEEEHWRSLTSYPPEDK